MLKAAWRSQNRKKGEKKSWEVLCYTAIKLMLSPRWLPPQLSGSLRRVRWYLMGSGQGCW